MVTRTHKTVDKEHRHAGGRGRNCGRAHRVLVRDELVDAARPFAWHGVCLVRVVVVDEDPVEEVCVLRSAVRAHQRVRARFGRVLGVLPRALRFSERQAVQDG